MTADAKVGLLLGLLFIGVIAFLLNAVPNIPRMTQAEEVVSVVSRMPADEPIVIENRIVHTANQLRESDVPMRETQPPREEIILDGSSQGIANNEPERPLRPEPRHSITPANPAPQPGRIAVQTHTVQRGDNLAVIAQKYYGAEEGNRRVVIQKLFEANKSILPSPDKVRLGQTLTIPPLGQLMGTLAASVVNTPQPQSQPQGERTFMERFSNLFERSDQEATTAIHVVQSGEGLWEIAEEKLGNGNRYKEILKLNKAIKNPDEIPAGMRLKLPAN